MPSPASPHFVDRPGDLPGVETYAPLTGIEIMRGILTGRFPAPPISRTMGFQLAEVALGRVVFQGIPDFGHFNVLGAVHGGWFGTLLDSCMGCAVHTHLPAGKGYSTLEYKVNLVRPAGVATGQLQAIGQITHVGRRTGVAEGRLVDADGKLYAQGSTTCLIFDL